MEEKIKQYLKEIISENKYKVKADDIGVEVKNSQNFTLIFSEGSVSVTRAKCSDNLKECVSSTLATFANHHDI
ncbi:MAG: hypothetical protein H2212_03640 [Ruminococcus sp.]|nr:hypothetical protein [Ruminococcus sp.]